MKDQMRKTDSDLARILVVVIWCAGLGVLTTWGNGDGAVAAAIGSSLLVGALVGRWWLPLGALAVLAAIAAGFAIDGYNGETELTPGAIAVLLYAYVVVLTAIPAAVGVGARRLAVAWWGVPDGSR